MANLLLLMLAQAAQNGVVANSMPPPAVIAVEPPTPKRLVPVGPIPQVKASASPGTARVMELAPLKPVTVAVRVLSGKKQLLSDSVSVGRSNATVIVQRTEAAPRDCPAGSAPTQQSSLTFQINREAASTADEFFFGLSWSRPINPCRIEGGLGISVTRSVTVMPSKTVVVAGDGDLRIELSRP